MIFLSTHCVKNWAKKYRQLSCLIRTNKAGSIITIMQDRRLVTEQGPAQEGRNEVCLKPDSVLSCCAAPQGNVNTRWPELMVCPRSLSKPAQSLCCTWFRVPTLVFRPLSRDFFLSSQVISHILLHALFLLTNRST